MSSDQKSEIRRYVQRWKEVGSFLQKMRVEELKTLNISDELFSLRDASEAALAMYPPKPTSGLIEMQRLFMKLQDETNI